MGIRFMTKEESNQLRLEEFLRLSPPERFMSFLKLSRRIQKFPAKAASEPNQNNFVLEKIRNGL